MATSLPRPREPGPRGLSQRLLSAPPPPRPPTPLTPTKSKHPASHSPLHPLLAHTPSLSHAQAPKPPRCLGNFMERPPAYAQEPQAMPASGHFHSCPRPLGMETDQPPPLPRPLPRGHAGPLGNRKQGTHPRAWPCAAGSPRALPDSGSFAPFLLREVRFASRGKNRLEKHT